MAKVAAARSARGISRPAWATRQITAATTAREQAIAR
jgi:hypothetical protein